MTMPLPAPPAGRPPIDAWAVLRAARRSWLVLVVTTVLGLLVGIGSTRLPSEEARPDTTAYRATATLVLDFSSLSDQSNPVLRNLDQAAIMVTSGDVPDRVAEDLGGDGAILAEQISTLTDSDAATLDITAVDRDPDRALTLASSFADNLIEVLRVKARTNADAERQRVIDRVKELTTRRDGLDQQIATPGVSLQDLEILKAQRDAVVNQFRITYTRLEALAGDTADPNILTTLGSPKTAVITGAEYRAAIERGRAGTNHSRVDPEAEAAVAAPASGTPLQSTPARAAAGAIFGFLVGLAIVFVRERLNPVARTRGDVERVVGCHVLAEVPPLSKYDQRERSVLVHDAPRSPTAEAYRGLRSSLLFLQETLRESEQPARRNAGTASRAFVIMVASGEPREGKTVSSANLAAAFAETGMTVAAVDCDFRCPNLAPYVEATGADGTTSPKIPGVTFVQAAPKDRRAHPAEAIARQREIIEFLRPRADVIVLDVAPLLITNDATELFAHADVAVLVVRAGQTRLGAAERVRELMARHDLPVAGAVVVAASVEAMAYYDYYTAGYGSYVSGTRAPAPTATPPGAVTRIASAPSERSAPSPSSVKALLPTSTSASPNGANGNGSNGHGAPPPE
jgi:Mrp family chromosome partitioning ATPase/capsular polysaccharide biosynthesis protein